MKREKKVERKNEKVESEEGRDLGVVEEGKAEGREGGGQRDAGRGIEEEGSEMKDQSEKSSERTLDGQRGVLQGDKIEEVKS